MFPITSDTKCQTCAVLAQDLPSSSDLRRTPWAATARRDKAVDQQVAPSATPTVCRTKPSFFHPVRTECCAAACARARSRHLSVSDLRFHCQTQKPPSDTVSSCPVSFTVSPGPTGWAISRNHSTRSVDKDWGSGWLLAGDAAQATVLSSVGIMVERTLPPPGSMCAPRAELFGQLERPRPGVLPHMPSPEVFADRPAARVPAARRAGKLVCHGALGASENFHSTSTHSEWERRGH